MAESVPSRSRSRGLLLLTVLFLIGVIAGASLAFIGIRALVGSGLKAGKGPIERHMILRMESQLDLDEEQSRRIRQIMRGSRERVHQELERTRKQIREVLTPDQQKRFDEMRPGRGFGPPGRRGPGRPPFGGDRKPPYRDRRDGPPPPRPGDFHRPAPEDAPPQQDPIDSGGQ